MKTLNLYYVFDRVGQCCVSGPIPAANDLVAAIGFRDSFIKKNKLPYDYKALNLVKFATLKVDENGCFSIPEQEVNEIPGADITNFISEKCAEYDINDTLLDNDEVKDEHLQ